jgi:hypothetical protein
MSAPRPDWLWAHQGDCPELLLLLLLLLLLHLPHHTQWKAGELPFASFLLT